MTTISIKIPVELDRRLRRASAQRHMSRSAIIREAAERYVMEVCGETDSCLDVASDLAGCVDGPEDLASNKAHLEGFGR